MGACKTWVQPWKLLLPSQSPKGAVWSVRTFCILPPLLQKSPRWEGSPTLHLRPQNPVSTCPLDTFTQIAQRHRTLRGPHSVVICPHLLSLPSYCSQRSRQAPVPESSWS